MDATLVKDIGIKALLVGGAVLVSFWTFNAVKLVISARGINPSVSYTHLRAHETSAHLVCRLLLEKKK